MEANTAREEKTCIEKFIVRLPKSIDLHFPSFFMPIAAAGTSLVIGKDNCMFATSVKCISRPFGKPRRWAYGVSSNFP